MEVSVLKDEGAPPSIEYVAGEADPSDLLYPYHQSDIPTETYSFDDQLHN